MINVNDLKNGMTVQYEGNIYTVLDKEHVKPGKGAAIVKAKLKNLRTGSIVEKRFNSGVKLEKAMVEKVGMQFLYATGDSYNFMNMETYEQIDLTKEQLGDNVNYLKEGLDVLISFYEGELLGIILPAQVDLKVVKTEPAVKGNTTNNATKDAELETGLVVRVPLFIENDEVISVYTADGKYASRA